MTFSELVYAIQNRGKTMNMKESKPMSLSKDKEVLNEAPMSNKDLAAGSSKEGRATAAKIKAKRDKEHATTMNAIAAAHKTVKEEAEPVEEAKSAKKITSYADWRKAGSPGGGWKPKKDNAPIKSAKNVPGAKLKKKAVPVWNTMKNPYTGKYEN
jgi:hypothetical protein